MKVSEEFLKLSISALCVLLIASSWALIGISVAGQLELINWFSSILDIIKLKNMPPCWIFYESFAIGMLTTLCGAAVLLIMNKSSSSSAGVGFCGPALAVCLIVQVLTLCCPLNRLVWSGSIEGWDTKQEIFTQLKRWFDSYRRPLFEPLQRHLNCCGINSPTDWLSHIPFEPDLSLVGIPASCCALNSTTCSLQSRDLYTVGCYWKLIDQVELYFYCLGPLYVLLLSLSFVNCIQCFQLKRLISRRSSIVGGKYAHHIYWTQN